MAAKTLSELVAGVSTNPALVEFPYEQWGFTSAMKKEVLKAASNVRGQPDKQEALIAALTVLVAHIKKRFDGDVAARATELARVRQAEKDREWRERTTGKVENRTATRAQ